MTTDMKQAGEDAKFEAEMDAVSTVYSFRPGHVLTQADFDAIQLFDAVSRRDQERAIDAFNKGYEQGLREGGSADIAAMANRVDVLRMEATVERCLKVSYAADAENLRKLIADLDCSDILGVAESCASGLPRWDHVSAKINAARAAIAKATGQ